MHEISGFFGWLSNILSGAKFWFIVLPWEKAVRVRFGKNSKVIEPGFHFRIPYGDHIVIINTRLRLSSSQSITVTSKDGKTVTMAVLVGFRITEPLKAMQALQQPESTCAAIVQGCAARAIADRNCSETAIEILREEILARLKEFTLGAIEFDTVEIVEYAVVKTYRLLQDSYKPVTYTENETVTHY